MAKIKSVGIPRAMYFFEYGEMWVKFFSFLGFKVIVSDRTDERTILRGSMAAPDDMCLPVKAMYGHILSFTESGHRPDYIFLPKMIKTEKKLYTCPKNMGLSDMIKCTVTDLPEVIDTEYLGDEVSFYLQIGKALGKTPVQSLKAYRAAKGAVSTVKEKEFPDKNAVVAVIGHPYILEDEALNMGIFRILDGLNIAYITAKYQSVGKLSQQVKKLPYKSPFWHSARNQLGFTEEVIFGGKVDGVILLSSYGCGTDPFVLPFCEDIVCAGGQKVPVMTLTLDEHKNAEGFVTRIEAFCDCVCGVRV